MARALLGHVGMVTDQNLVFELARLRRRVAELESELAQLRTDEPVAIDLELHRMAEAAEPVLT